MANGDIWQVVNTSYLRIRTSASVYASSTGQLSGGDEITETGRATVDGVLWIGHSLGWSASESCGTAYLVKIRSAASSVTTITQNTAPPQDTSSGGSSSGNSGSNGESVGYQPTVNNSYDDSVGAGYQPDVNDILSYKNVEISDSEFIKIKNVAGVFGLPYQFLPSADVRLAGDTSSENIGYEYADKIVNRMPLMFLTPGKASFMTRYSKKNRADLIERLIKEKGISDSGNLEDLLTSDGKYYTFEYDRSRYYKYVNPMCRIAARLLEIQDMELNGTKLDLLNWEQYADNGIMSVIGGNCNYGGVPFYVDTDTSVSEGFSNSTTQSMLSSSVNSVSDMGRELNFLLGYGAGTNYDAVMRDEDVVKNLENVDDLVGKLLGNGSFLTNISKHLITVASGGKLIFPEIWNDSNFSRSYNVEIKLVSPDPSKFSVYLNVLVPLFHLLGLVAPQTDSDNPNGYVNPFLVRAVYKGFFNVDMGIITDMSITKGAECQWTPEGIPTSINVSLGIKDLYSAMSITSTESTDWKYDTLNNTALMDYIANLCGINIFEPEVGRMIDMWFTNNFTNRVKDFFAVDIWAGIQDKIQNIIMNIYR